MSRITTLVAMIVLAVSSLSAQSAAVPPGEYVPVVTFDPKRNASEDIREAVVDAKETGRRVLLDVGGEWCIWCKRLDQFFEENKDVAEVLHRNFVTVKVNYSKENTNEAVLSRYPKVAGYPHLFVLENDGTLIHSQDTGQLEKGKGHDRDKILAFLNAWAPGH